MSRLLIAAVLLCIAANAQPPLMFKGRRVTLNAPKLEALSPPAGPASVCLEGPPRRQCYEPPVQFERFPAAEVIDFADGTSAIFFTAEMRGVAGWDVHFAILTPDSTTHLTNLLSGSDTATNLHQRFWLNAPEISADPILVIADYIWAPGESRHSPHRHIVSAYVRWSAETYEDPVYQLDDRYMTTRYYEVVEVSADDIFAAERDEILARLRRINASRAERQ